MGGPRLRSLEGIAKEGGNLRASCCSCPHRSVLPAAELRRYFAARGWVGALEVIGGRLRCSRCGRREPHVRPTWRPPDAAWRHPTTEWEWTRLVRKLRG